MKRSVLDSCALLAHLLGEPRGRVVRKLLEQAREGDRLLFCCWVNITEVHYAISRRLGQHRAAEILRILEELPISFLPAGRDICLRAAEIKRQHTIALGDAFAAATALVLEAEVVTGDPEFRQLEGVVSVRWLAT